MTGQLWITALGGAVAGAFLTGIVTLLTTIMNRRHEHRRWLLDRRLEVYSAFNEASAAWSELFLPGHMPTTEQLDRITAVEVQYSRLALIAPEKTERAANSLVEYATELSDLADRLQTPTLKMDTIAETYGWLLHAQEDLLELQRNDIRGAREHRLRELLRKV